jgi:hypothetical protein
MTDYQVAAILDNYLRDNPARWHESMNTPSRWRKVLIRFP